MGGVGGTGGGGKKQKQTKNSLACSFSHPPLPPLAHVSLVCTKERKCLYDQDNSGTNKRRMLPQWIEHATHTGKRKVLFAQA